MKALRKNFLTTSAIAAAFLFMLAFTPRQALQAADDELPEFTHDGLQRVINSRAAYGYIKPDTDFSGYDRIMILDCYVAFKKDWKKEFNRSNRSLTQRITDKDMERMKNDMAEAFREVFVAELTENDGYELADAPADDVLLIRPAIIDLDAHAPDTQPAGRSYTFVDSAGAATLYIELYDSVSGEILARAIDRKADRGHGRMEWSSGPKNRAAARRVLRQWAGWLRERMDEVRGTTD
ncbi:MAG: DUF3313 family protein [Woeseiaceae bacterium]